MVNPDSTIQFSFVPRQVTVKVKAQRCDSVRMLRATSEKAQLEHACRLYKHTCS